MIKFIHDSWESVMNMELNPLRHIPDMQVRHLVIQLLAWMWCIAFSLYFGSFVVFGYTVVAHFILIIAIVITVIVFKDAEKKRHYHPDGTLNYDNGIGQRGQVYSRIRPNESGEIQIPINDTLKTVSARAKDKSLLIQSGEFIKVVDRIGSTMIVVPLDYVTSEE